MSIQLRLILLFASFFLLLGGGQGVLIAVAERQPTIVTCADYIANRVSARWVELRGCDVALRAALNFYPVDGDSTADVGQIYIPIGNPADGNAPDSHVFLATRDRELVTIYNGFADYYYTPLEKGWAFLDKHATKLGEVRTVRGLARRGVELATHERNIEIDGRRGWDDIVVVDEGAEPEWGISLFMFGGGLALAFGTLGLHRLFTGRHRNSDPAG